MEACADARLRFVVCDRPNPIGGAVEGAPQSTGLPHLRRPAPDPRPPRHDGRASSRGSSRRSGGWTSTSSSVRRRAGRATCRSPRRACRGSRPRRTCRRPATALVYPGMCLLEGTNLSEGRGHDAALRALRRALARRRRARRGAERAGDCPASSSCRRSSGRCSTSTRARPCGGRAAARHRPRRRSGRSRRACASSRRRAGLAPLEFRWRTEPYEFDDRPAIDLLTGSSELPRDGRARARACAPRSRVTSTGPGRSWRGASAHLLYPDRRPAVVAFVGGHDSGKTTHPRRARPAPEGEGPDGRHDQAHDAGRARTTRRARTRSGTRRRARPSAFS